MRIWIAAAALLMFAAPAWAQTLVRAGGYDFPPFVETGPAGAKGIALDLIEALNQAQSEYRFEFTPVSARRRYSDAEAGRFDVMFFESPVWGWGGYAELVDFTPVFLRGGEKFVALAAPGRGQDYFASLADKRLAGILGYHYAFADFEADPKLLAQRFDIKLVASHRSSLDLVLTGRRDVAVATNSYLSLYFKENPEARGKFLVSDHFDQIYEHRVMVRRSGPLNAERMQGLMTVLERQGKLAEIWARWGISP